MIATNKGFIPDAIKFVYSKQDVATGTWFGSMSTTADIMIAMQEAALGYKDMQHMSVSTAQLFLYPSYNTIILIPIEQHNYSYIYIVQHNYSYTHLTTQLFLYPSYNTITLIPIEQPNCSCIPIEQPNYSYIPILQHNYSYCKANP